MNRLTEFQPIHQGHINITQNPKGLLVCGFKIVEGILTIGKENNVINNTQALDGLTYKVLIIFVILNGNNGAL